MSTYQPHSVGGCPVKLKVLVRLDEVIVTADLDGAIAQTRHSNGDATSTHVDRNGWSLQRDQLPWIDIEASVHSRVTRLLSRNIERSSTVILCLASLHYTVCITKQNNTQPMYINHHHTHAKHHSIPDHGLYMYHTTSSSNISIPLHTTPHQPITHMHHSTQHNLPHHSTRCTTPLCTASHCPTRHPCMQRCRALNHMCIHRTTPYYATPLHTT